MYSSGYSQVSKHSLEAKKKMQYRSKGKSCGYYMRIVFFFSSLIQSLIIVSLVLFLVYGKRQDSASTTRIQDLEESFSKLSLDNVALKEQRKNLTNLLNTTLTEKARNDWELAKIRGLANVSWFIIKDSEKKLQQCHYELMTCKNSKLVNGCTQTRSIADVCNCGLQTERLTARLQLVESNFTQTRQRIRMEMDQITKERDNINLEAIHLRRSKSTQEKELEFYRIKCREDFAQSLSGVSNVSRAFLQKIESLFPSHIAFQLTCQNQREHLEQIRTNCTSLSREVEDKFQRYLNFVGDQVSVNQAENSRLKAENWRLSEDYRWCSQNRSGMIQQHRQNFEKFQLKHDKDKETLLMDKMKLNGEIEVLNNNVRYKNKEVEHLTEQMKQLNMSCMFKTASGGYPGGTTRLGQTSQSGAWNPVNNGGSSSSSSSGLGQFVRTGSGVGSSISSSGSVFNKPVSTGLGSSSYGSPLSNPNLSSSGSAFNKPGSTGLGSSSYGSTGSSPNLSLNKPATSGRNTPTFGSSLGSTGSNPNLSSSGLGLNKPGSTGLGSTSYGSTGSSPNLSPSGSGLNKPGSTGLGSSSYGSVGSNPNLSSGGIGSNKPTSSVKSSPGLGSTGSVSKSGSTSSGFSWLGLGLGNTNTGQSKPGSGIGKGTSTGSSSSGTGSVFGTGRTSGLGGGSVSVNQHLQDLQHFINPAGPEEKQDLSRMLG